MTKQEFLNTVVAANESSMQIFTALVDQIDVVTIDNPVRVSDSKIDEIAGDIADQIVSEGFDLVEDYDLELDYSKQVSLQDVTLDESRIQDIIKDVLTQYFERYDAE